MGSNYDQEDLQFVTKFGRNVLKSHEERRKRICDKIQSVINRQKRYLSPRSELLNSEKGSGDCRYADNVTVKNKAAITTNRITDIAKYESCKSDIYTNQIDHITLKNEKCKTLSRRDDCKHEVFTSLGYECLLSNDIAHNTNVLSIASNSSTTNVSCVQDMAISRNATSCTASLITACSISSRNIQEESQQIDQVVHYTNVDDNQVIAANKMKSILLENNQLPAVRKEECKNNSNESVAKTNQVRNHPSEIINKRYLLTRKGSSIANNRKECQSVKHERSVHNICKSCGSFISKIRSKTRPTDLYMATKVGEGHFVKASSKNHLKSCKEFNKSLFLFVPSVDYLELKDNVSFVDVSKEKSLTRISKNNKHKAMFGDKSEYVDGCIRKIFDNKSKFLSETESLNSESEHKIFKPPKERDFVDAKVNRMKDLKLSQIKVEEQKPLNSVLKDSCNKHSAAKNSEIENHYQTVGNLPLSDNKCERSSLEQTTENHTSSTLRKNKVASETEHDDEVHLSEYTRFLNKRDTSYSKHFEKEEKHKEESKDISNEERRQIQIPQTKYKILKEKEVVENRSGHECNDTSRNIRENTSNVQDLFEDKKPNTPVKTENTSESLTSSTTNSHNVDQHSDVSSHNYKTMALFLISVLPLVLSLLGVLTWTTNSSV